MENIYSNNTVPRGIGLRESEWLELDNIAKELDMKTHALAVWAVRYFMNKYKNGEIETRVSKKLIDFTIEEDIE